MLNVQDQKLREMIDSLRPRLYPLLGGLVVSMAALLCFTRVNTEGYWYDEVMSVQLASQSWAGLFHTLIYGDVHPPLFFVLLKLFGAVTGFAESQARVLPILCSLGGLIGALSLGRSVARKDIGLLLALYFCFSPLVIRYATELRPYSLLFLCAVLTLDAETRIRRAQPSRWAQVYWILSNMAMVYTHYFGVIYFAAKSIAFQIYPPRMELRSYLKLCAWPVFAFAFWLPFLWIQSHETHLTHLAEFVGPSQLITHFSPNPFRTYSDKTIPWILTAYAVAYLFALSLRSSVRKSTLTLIGGYLLFVAISLWKPIGEMRNMIVFLPAYGLGVCATLASAEGSPRRSMIAAIVLTVVGLLSLGDAPMYRPRFDFRALAQTVQRIESTTNQKRLAVVTFTEPARLTMKYYLPDHAVMLLKGDFNPDKDLSGLNDFFVPWHSFLFAEERSRIPELLRWSKKMNATIQHWQTIAVEGALIRLPPTERSAVDKKRATPPSSKVARHATARS